MKIEDSICRSGAGPHCSTCRKRDEGRKWRASLASHYAVPGGVVDFACPFGKAWIEPTPPSVPTVDYIFAIAVACGPTKIIRDTIRAAWPSAKCAVSREPHLRAGNGLDRDEYSDARKAEIVAAQPGLYVETSHLFVHGWGWEVARLIPHDRIGVVVVDFDAKPTEALLSVHMSRANEMEREWFLWPGGMTSDEAAAHHVARTVQRAAGFREAFPGIQYHRTTMAQLGTNAGNRAMLEAFGLANPPTPKASRGLGDTIAKITSAVGIKPCGGCKERQALLNKIVPYKGNDGQTKLSNGSPK